MHKIKFSGLEFKTLKKKDLLKEEEFLKFIVTVNSEFIVKAQKDGAFKNIINNNYATFDGQVPYLLARLMNPKSNFDKLSGSDLIYDFCNMAKNEQRKVFLLGGYEQSNKDAVRILRNRYNISIDGFSPIYKPYPFTKSHNESILEAIQKFKPEILFVGFGAIKQEFWINEHKSELENMGIKWVVGSGGTFEFVSGKLKRSPKLLQKIGLEGLFRFFMEPSKLRFQRLLTSFGIFRYMYK
jgi:N-acetylglucosaminyldiphosphoundecaprenol N-acetyl-beta-D-mannosaminyltransferase